MAREDYTPTIGELAPLMRARLRTDETFTETSRPSLADAASQIEAGVDRVFLRIGEPIEVLRPAAKRVALYQAAANLESAGYPEQTRGDVSPREYWQKLADDALDALAEAHDRLDDGGDADGDGVTDGGLATWSTPCEPLVAGRPW